MEGVAEWTYLLWQEQKFKLTILQSTANEFEKIFTKIMRAANGDSFHVSRAGGPKGDLKCDGWDSATKTLYSVYAPSSAKTKREVRTKIAGDLRGARKRWPEMRRWRFVHNDFFGLSAEVTRELENLRSDPSNANLEVLSDWDPEDLWRIVRNLSYVDRLELLGGPPVEIVVDKPQWEGLSLRYHDGANPAGIRAAMASLSQLCNNFRHDSVLDPICASAMARAITSWWLEDKDAVRGESLLLEYLEFLVDRCDSLPCESQITSLAFLMRTIEICARKIKVTPEVLADSQVRADADLPEDLKVIIQIAREEMTGGSQGFWVEDSLIRRKFVSACGRAIIHLIGMTSTGTQYPAIFLIQDLIISMQRVDVKGGRL
ncbi:hypothetical protein ABGB07_35485 [Micromonosporaceae bacterium B7E4]